MLSIRELRDLYSQAANNKAAISHLYEEAFAFVFSNANTFYEGTNSAQFGGSGSRRNYEVYSAAAPTAAREMLSWLMNQMVPQDTVWGEVVLTDTIKDVIRAEQGEQAEPIIDEFDEQARKLSRKMFRHIANSNFYNELGGALRDFTVGTCVMLAELNPGWIRGDAESPVNFTTAPLSCIGLIKDHQRRPIVFFERSVSCAYLMQKYPHTRAKVMDSVGGSDITKLHERKVILIDCYIPRDDIMGCEHYVFAHESGELGNYVVHEAEYPMYRPVMIGMWAENPGEQYGRGVALDAMPNVRTLNELIRSRLALLELNMGGILAAREDLAWSTMNPGAIPKVIITENDPREITNLFQGMNMNPAMLEQEHLEQAIRKTFFADIITPEMLERLPQQTATAVSIAQENSMTRLYEPLSRFQDQILKPILRQVVNIMRLVGETPSPNFSIDEKNFTLKFSSPLTRMQQVAQVSRLLRFTSAIQQTGIPPEIVMTKVNMDEVLNQIAERLDVPEKCLYSNEEAIQMRQSMAQQEREMQELGGGSAPRSPGVASQPGQEPLISAGV